MTKRRVPIPVDLAARVLFDADRTCCVCRERKPVQIHHIDDDPSHNDYENLAVLCFDCHRETQINGGFDRKLDAGQVRLYRVNWLDAVRSYRLTPAATGIASPAPKLAVQLAELEMAQRKRDWLAVARVYNRAGDTALRDEYIEKFLTEDPSARNQLLAARLRGTVDQLPGPVKEAAAAAAKGDWTSYGRALLEIGDVEAGVRVLLAGVQRALKNDNPFTAAYYLRHVLNDAAVDLLFQKALRSAAERGDLWWQLRAYEELGWKSEATALLIENQELIRQEGRPVLQLKLARALRDDDEVIRLTKLIGELGVSAHFSVIASRDDGGESNRASPRPKSG